MTAVMPGRDRRQLPVAVRRAGAVVAAAALGTLVAIGPPVASARAASTGFDQITGSGTTPSAVNASWIKGLLGANNQPLASSPGELAPNSDRSSATPTGPLSFMYDDFKSLKVTVGQTTNITQQGLTVSWSGALPSVVAGSDAQSGFMQLMECYGDNANGPDPTECEFGSAGMLPAGVTNPRIGQRIGVLCAGGAASPPPPGSFGGGVPAADGEQGLVGCDPQEPGAGRRDIAPCPGPDCDVTGTNFDIPFVPVPASDGTTSPAAWDPSETSQYFNQFDTNEVQEAVTGTNGKGQVQFETLTSTTANGLGCGALESNGQPRNCWLVIVPRGTFEPNGYRVFPPNNANSFDGQLYSSPLSASNWAMRIQVHLDYAPVSSFCPLGTPARLVAGSQLAQRAMQSWELALNQQANCSKTYDFSQTAENSSTIDLCSPSNISAGLAFTTIPIGSEAAREGTVPPCSPLPKILYAPVAVTALGFGFNINNGTGFISTPVNMTPALFARAVTQVYRDDLPDYYPPVVADTGPAWSVSNPANMSLDPEFIKLNPEVPPFTASNTTVAPLLTVDHSGLTQQIWQWVQTDPATVAWLDKGTKIAGSTVSADPDYEKLLPQLGRAPGIGSFPRAYTGVLNLLPGQDGNQLSHKTQQRHSLDLLPYVNNYNDAASKVLTAVNPASGNWSDQAISPSGGTGWWQTLGPEVLGKVFLWGVSDTSDLAAYGLVDAALCDAAGTPSSCVTPSVASLTTALASAKPDSAGLLQVNPARPGKHGYPLTEVVYAAVSENQSAAAYKDYATLISYAAGAGQTAGVAPGNLPPGYLPLTKSLRRQAQAVVGELLKLAAPPTPSRSPATVSSPAPAAVHPSVTPSPASSSPAEFTISQASPQLAAATTQRQVLGAIRWALLVVVIVGAACATSGAALRSARVPAWLKRMRT